MPSVLFCAIWKRHTKVSIMLSTFRRFVLSHCWIVDPRPSFFNMCLLLLGYNISRGTSVFVCVLTLTARQIFYHTQKNFINVFTEPISPVAWIASSQKESGLGWVYKWPSSSIKSEQSETISITEKWQRQYIMAQLSANSVIYHRVLIRLLEDT